MKQRLPVRERIIETASNLFYSQGYNRTGINEILEKSGVAKASMYQHFRSKEEICVAYLKRMDGLFFKDLTASMEKKPSGRAQVTGIFDFILDFYHQEGFRGCWCQNTLSEIPMSDQAVVGEIRRQKLKFRRYLADQIRNNLKVKKPKQLADRIYLLYESSLLESQIFMEDWPMKEGKKVAEILIRNASAT